MVFKKYKITNNAICELDVPISNTDLSLQATWWYDRFPTENFIVKVTEKDIDWVVVSRENMYILLRSWNTFTVSDRAYEAVPISDVATENTNTALEFNAWAVIELVISEEVIKDIQNEVERLENDKLNKDWWTRKWWTPNTMVYFDSNWDEQEVNIWSVWQVLTSNWPTNAPDFWTPPLDIVWQSEETSIADNDSIPFYDTSTGTNKKTNFSNFASEIKSANTDSYYIPTKRTKNKATSWATLAISKSQYLSVKLSIKYITNWSSTSKLQASNDWWSTRSDIHSLSVSMAWWNGNQDYYFNYYIPAWTHIKAICTWVYWWDDASIEVLYRS